jgi:hypothetical protein
MMGERWSPARAFMATLALMSKRRHNFIIIYLYFANFLLFILYTYNYA